MGFYQEQLLPRFQDKVMGPKAARDVGLASVRLRLPDRQPFWALAYFAPPGALWGLGLERTRWVAANNYSVELLAGTSIAERVPGSNGPAGPLSRMTASDR